MGRCSFCVCNVPLFIAFYWRIFDIYGQLVWLVRLVRCNVSTDWRNLTGYSCDSSGLKKETATKDTSNEPCRNTMVRFYVTAKDNSVTVTRDCNPRPFFNPEILGLWETKSRDLGIRNIVIVYWELEILLILLLLCEMHASSLVKVKGKGFPVLDTERWARSWSWCTGSQPAGDRKSSTRR